MSCYFQGNLLIALQLKFYVKFVVYTINEESLNIFGQIALRFSTCCPHWYAIISTSCTLNHHIIHTNTEEFFYYTT